MDISPQELRQSEIKDSMRGYNHDDVDDLLERAAATIDGLNQKVRELADQSRSGASTSAPADPRAQQEEVLSVLSLAQRTADEAVREANTRARKVMADAETKIKEAETHAKQIVEEAEGNAIKASEEARRQAEVELRDLAHRRDILESDIDALERFEKDYRFRVKEALETELDMLTNRPMGGPGPKPEVREVEIPAAAAPVPPPAPAPAPAAAAPVASSSPPAHRPKADAEDADTGMDSFSAATISTEAELPVPDVEDLPSVPRYEPAMDAEVEDLPEPSADPWLAHFSARRGERDEVEGELGAPESFPDTPPSENMDDDAFFASLRDAVDDTKPLGPDDSEGDEPSRR